MPRQNGHRFADEIFKCILLNENFYILTIMLKLHWTLFLMVQLTITQHNGLALNRRQAIIWTSVGVCYRLVYAPFCLKELTRSCVVICCSIRDLSIPLSSEYLSCNHYSDVIMTTMASQITSLTVVYSTVYSDADQRKHQSSASLAFVWGIHRDRWIPRTKGQLRGKWFHLMTSSWYGCICSSHVTPCGLSLQHKLTKPTSSVRHA